MHRVRPRFYQLLDRRVALGDPWPFVKQPRDFEERRDVELDDFRAEAGELFEIGGEGALRLRVAKKFALMRSRRADAKVRRGRQEARRGEPAGIGIGGIVTRRDTEGRKSAGDLERKNGDRVQRPAGGNEAARRERAERRF